MAFSNVKREEINPLIINTDIFNYNINSSFTMKMKKGRDFSFTFPGFHLTQSPRSLSISIMQYDQSSDQQLQQEKFGVVSLS